MNFRAARIEYYLRTIEAVIASPRINHFNIGYTYLQSWKKLATYRPEEYEHLIILEDKMTRSQALALEKAIQITVLRKPDSPLYPKYHPKKRDKAYYSSDGGIKSPADEPVHSVYMAWW